MQLTKFKKLHQHVLFRLIDILQHGKFTFSRTDFELLVLNINIKVD